MQREYRVSKITKIYCWIVEIFTVFGIIVIFFLKQNSQIWEKLVAIAAFFLMTFVVSMNSKFKFTFDEEKFTVRNILSLFLFFFPKYITCKWEDIKVVDISCGFLFEEFVLVTVGPKYKIKGAMVIPVGFGIPFSSLQEILSHIPKDAEVRIDPALKKYIDNPKKMYRYNITLGIMIIVIVAIWTFWLFSRPDIWNTLKQNLPKAIQQFKIKR